VAIVGVQTFKEVSPFLNAYRLSFFQLVRKITMAISRTGSQSSQHPSGFIDPISSPTITSINAVQPPDGQVPSTTKYLSNGSVCAKSEDTRVCIPGLYSLPVYAATHVYIPQTCVVVEAC